MNNIQKSHKYPTNKRGVLILGAAALFILACAVLILKNNQNVLAIPEGINFRVWVPAKHTNDYAIRENTMQYSEAADTISYKLSYKKNNILTFTQQAVPESFSVVPEAFDKQVSAMQQVTKFDSVNGLVSITKPYEEGQGTAIMKAKGTILYVNPSKRIELDEWRKIFNDLELQQ